MIARYKDQFISLNSLLMGTDKRIFQPLHISWSQCDVYDGMHSIAMFCSTWFKIQKNRKKKLFEKNAREYLMALSAAAPINILLDLIVDCGV